MKEEDSMENDLLFECAKNYRHLMDYYYDDL